MTETMKGPVTGKAAPVTLKYIIIADTNSDELCIRITNMILEGWQCTGGLCLGSTVKNGITYVTYNQAMVKYD